MVVQPRDAEYSHVPTHKELELSRRLVELQQEKHQREQKLLSQIADLESQVHALQVRINDISQMLQTTKREQIHTQQLAVEDERNVWRAKVDALQRELNQEKHDKDRVAAQNGLQVLLYVTNQSKRFGHDESALAAACARARRPLADLQAVQESDERAAARDLGVCGLRAHPSGKRARDAARRQSRAKARDGQDRALGARARKASAHGAAGYVVPSWLTTGIQTLAKYAAANGSESESGLDAVDAEDTAAATEFHERSYFSLESLTEIAPDELCPHFYA